MKRHLGSRITGLLLFFAYCNISCSKNLFSSMNPQSKANPTETKNLVETAEYDWESILDMLNWELVDQNLNDVDSSQGDEEFTYQDYPFSNLYSINERILSDIESDDFGFQTVGETLEILDLDPFQGFELSENEIDEKFANASEMMMYFDQFTELEKDSNYDDPNSIPRRRESPDDEKEPETKKPDTVKAKSQKKFGKMPSETLTDMANYASAKAFSFAPHSIDRLFFITEYAMAAWELHLRDAEDENGE